MAFAPLAALPKGVLVIFKEAARHLLRRPVVGSAAVARTRDGRWLLIRRADTGEWALPGGTLEWGETLRASLARELAEEAGVDRVELGRVLGVLSGVDRDPRFHAVTVAVECIVDEPARPPANPLEIREARLFADADLPRAIAFGHGEMIALARAGGSTVLE